MDCYLVGGAVRDMLLGLKVADRDFVVVGATAQSMGRLGFLPVGSEFPIFLHPKTKEEYALARTERKIAKGYKGFAFRADPSITLEEDLKRRDLTINAMAVDSRALAPFSPESARHPVGHCAGAGSDACAEIPGIDPDSADLIDPYGGLEDLRRGVLRHVSEAFREDPVRALRCARFAARFGFEADPETLGLIRDMAEAGEIDALTPERARKELDSGLMTGWPSEMFRLLDRSGALERVFPEIAALRGAPNPWQDAGLGPQEADAFACAMGALDAGAELGLSAEQRHALLTLFFASRQDVERFCARTRASARQKKFALAVRQNAPLLLDPGRRDGEQALSCLRSLNARHDATDLMLAIDCVDAAARLNAETALRLCPSFSPDALGAEPVAEPGAMRLGRSAPQVGEPGRLGRRRLGAIEFPLDSAPAQKARRIEERQRRLRARRERGDAPRSPLAQAAALSWLRAKDAIAALNFSDLEQNTREQKAAASAEIRRRSQRAAELALKSPAPGEAGGIATALGAGSGRPQGSEKKGEAGQGLGGARL